MFRTSVLLNDGLPPEFGEYTTLEEAIDRARQVFAELEWVEQELPFSVTVSKV